MRRTWRRNLCPRWVWWCKAWLATASRRSSASGRRSSRSWPRWSERSQPEAGKNLRLELASLTKWFNPRHSDKRKLKNSTVLTSFLVRFHNYSVRVDLNATDWDTGHHFFLVEQQLMSHDVIIFCQRLGAIRWHAISNAGKLTKSEAMFKTVGSRNRSVISGPQTSANTCVQRRKGWTHRDLSMR